MLTECLCVVNSVCFVFSPHSLEDQCKTEEELPPLMLGDDFKCKNFYPEKNKYFHLHGGKSSMMKTTNLHH